jgi:aryl-alcohol dehydrogenase-like predicted oxidoreductase
MATELTLDGVRLFDCVQATWNLLERSAGPALRRAHEAGMGVLVKEALANGRLTARNPDAVVTGPLAREAERLGASMDGLALAAVLAERWVDVVLSGATRPEQLASNLTALEVAWDAEVAGRLAELIESPEAYWARRGALAWN